MHFQGCPFLMNTLSNSCGDKSNNMTSVHQTAMNYECQVSVLIYRKKWTYTYPPQICSYNSRSTSNRSLATMKPKRNMKPNQYCQSTLIFLLHLLWVIPYKIAYLNAKSPLPPSIQCCLLPTPQNKCLWVHNIRKWRQW